MQGFLNSAQAERELAMDFCMCWLVPGWGWILLSLAYFSLTHSLSQDSDEIAVKRLPSWRVCA
ncbi:hypothetical protein V8C43DRAFT_293482 [Trichoderma afarasin]